MKITRLVAVLSLGLVFLSAPSQAQERQFPVIKSGGGVFPVPEAARVADAALDYKIVGDLMVGPEKPNELNPGLERVGRLFNAYSEAGIPANKINMVVVVHFKGTPLILNDEAYKKEFGVPNPNTALINELAGKGVQFYICGQSLRMRGYTDTPRNTNIQVTHAALIATTTYQLKGYALLSL